jgi:predicted DNA-binding transcriptional regulator YafY
MRADRLLSILILLQSRGLLTARELARELEVSERTIYRDMDVLSAAGFPVYADTGRRGGYALLGDYDLDLTGFNTRDLQALAALEIPKSLDEIGLGDALRNALLKLFSTLEGDRLSDRQWMQQRFLMDTPPSQSRLKGKSDLPHLQKAVWEDRWIECRLRYPIHFGLSEPLRIAPYILVTADGRWYLIGARNDFQRVYSLEMLVNIQLLDETFTRPADYLPGPVWCAWVAAQEGHERGNQRGLDTGPNRL